MWKLWLLRDRHRFPSLAIVAHSQGGLVVRAFLTRHGERFPQVRLFVSVSTPWAGEPAAALGVRLAPGPVPSWHDLVPDGEPARRRFERPLPAHVRHLLLFTHRSRFSPLSAFRSSSDGTVTLASQLHWAAQAEADRILGFDEDHDSVLVSPAVFERFSEALAESLDCPDGPTSCRSSPGRSPSRTPGSRPPSAGRSRT